MSENLTYVPSRLTSAKTDKTIAGANEILDDDLHLKQNVINVLTKKVVTLNSAPTSSTLTYTYNSVTCNFTIGDEVRVADNTQGDAGTNNYIYYKLFDINNGVAYWDLIGGREVEIGETSPLSNVKLFVDENANPQDVIPVYNKTQIDALTRHTRKTDFDLNVLKQAVADGNLEKYGLKVGDEKTINGYTYVIADLNTMKGSLVHYRVTVNHVGLIVIPHTTVKWNASGNTYTGANNRGAGYKNCDLYDYLKTTILSHVENDLGAENLIEHSKILSNNVNTTATNKMANDSNKGASSNWDWENNCKICALSEVQVYGTTVWSSSGYDTGEACRQLEVFQKYSHTEIFGNEYIWLRDIATANHVCYVNYSGSADPALANTDIYVAALVLFH